jgi:hypothetical protein
VTSPRIPDADFIRLFEEIGPKKLGDRLGISQRSVFKRRDTLQRKYKRKLVAPPQHMGTKARAIYVEYPGRLNVSVPDGVVLVASDCHYWPGEPSLMHRALVRFCRELKPKIVVLNGDVIDACSISRHPPIGWDRAPTVQEEIEAAQDRLHEIEAAAGRALKYWPLGNHDGRFETRLATVAPEFAKVVGVSLKDHFPAWVPCWSLFVNDDVVIKHRYAGGIHATYNNTLRSGRTIVTGHLHSAQVRPWSDYSGTRWGVDTGCLAEPYGPQFEYLEDNPRNWVSAFAVLTFRDGRLLWPELVTRWADDAVQFRGEVIKL